MKIFISYRRQDSAASTGRLYDHLTGEFGRDAIFKDVDNMPLGYNFLEVVTREIGKSDIVLVVIGTKYLSLRDKNEHIRIFTPNDPVKLEVTTALKLKKVVVPILVDNTEMLRADQLPESIKELSYLHGLKLRHAEWNTDFRKLVTQLRSSYDARLKEENKRSTQRKTTVNNFLRQNKQILRRSDSEMKTFLFILGGTGARILRAFTMLMAMGVKMESHFIPIIIDLDLDNGDVKRAMRLLSYYQLISRAGYSKYQESGFFSNSLWNLSEIEILTTNNKNKFEPGLMDSFRMNFRNVSDSFADHIKTEQLSPLNYDFLELLFDDSPAHNSNTELNLDLDKGLRGNSKLGSLLLSDLNHSPEFKHFEKVFSQNDRIFIIGSSFGGTGVAGISQIVKCIRGNSNETINKASIGSLVVGPYFKINSVGNNTIDSDIFNTKTKLALDYFNEELNNEINSIYYLADKSGTVIENNIGGIDQKNKASVIEFIGALAVLKYINNPVDEGSVSYEYGVNDDDQFQNLSLTNYGEREVWMSFTKFTIFAKFFMEELEIRIEKNEPFAKDLNLAKGLSREVFYKQLRAFVDEYWDWLKEMEQGDRPFSVFNLDGSFSKLIKGKNIESLNKISFIRDVWKSAIGYFWKEIRNDHNSSDEEKFMQLMNASHDRIFEKYMHGRLFY